MNEARRRSLEEDRLYPTVREELEFRELKERYGVKDSVVFNDQSDKDDSEQLRTIHS